MKCFLLLDRHVPREDLSVRDFPMRDEVMAWIRACEAGDLLPGLCAFVEKVRIVVCKPSIHMFDEQESLDTIP